MSIKLIKLNWPSILKYPEVGNEFQIIVERTSALDSMMVKAELKPEAFTDSILELNKVRERIEHKFRSTLNVSACVELVQPGTLPRFEGKAKRVIDNRKSWRRLRKRRTPWHSSMLHQ